ncbi:MAG: hypothetical protein Q9184_007410 [Pyrenodesmia sp. 2 TL-2023]
MLSRHFNGVRACSNSKLLATSTSRPTRSLWTILSYCEHKHANPRSTQLSSQSRAAHAKAGQYNISRDNMSVTVHSCPSVTQPATSNNSSEKIKPEPDLTGPWAFDGFSTVSAMSYLFTDQLDRLVRTGEFIRPSHQKPLAASANHQMLRHSSNTKDGEVKEDESLIEKREMNPTLIRGANNSGLYSKTVDNPVEIALRALDDENGLGNYSESEERAVSCFRLGL